MQFHRLCAAFCAALFLAACQVPRSVAPQTVQPSKDWEKDIAAFEAQDRTNPPPANPIVFTGSSSVRMWETLAADFPGRPVVNRGFGGSHLADSIYYANRILLPLKPRKILIYAGTNDIKDGKTPSQVFADFQTFVELVHAKLPETEIAYICIAPNPARWSMVDKMREANLLIRNYARWKGRVTYIDIFTPMLSGDGLPKEGIYDKDRLHMNENGYRIWKKVIEPEL